MIAQRFLVSGRVQGVFFRASTRKEAERLQLQGHALNLPDGRVEVLAVGTQEAVAALGEWLRSGPALAKVSALESQAVDPTEVVVDGFSCA